MVLAEICRDLTAFQTPLELLRMTTLPQGCTNGVQVFDRVMKKILRNQISAKGGKPFIDDVGVKPPTSAKKKLRLDAEVCLMHHVRQVNPTASCRVPHASHVLY